MQLQFGSNTQKGSDVERETVCERRRCRLFVISSPVELNKKIIPRFWCRKCRCFESPQHSRRCPRWTGGKAVSLPPPLSYFSAPLILQALSRLSLSALCRIAVWLLEAATAARLSAKLRAEYQCSATVTAGNICPFEKRRKGGERRRDGHRERVR